jgi:hypothetical protein
MPHNLGLIDSDLGVRVEIIVGLIDSDLRSKLILLTNLHVSEN